MSRYKLNSKARGILLELYKLFGQLKGRKVAIIPRGYCELESRPIRLKDFNLQRDRF
jgi:hypothetical protein